MLIGRGLSCLNGRFAEQRTDTGGFATEGGLAARALAYFLIAYGTLQLEQTVCLRNALLHPSAFEMPIYTL